MARQAATLQTPSISTTFEAQADGQYQIAVQVQQAKITYFDPTERNSGNRRRHQIQAT